MTETRALALVSFVLLAVRLHAASVVGFGDSEALYASWALHPQPSYLDHPGLVGLVARLVGEGAPPTPLRAHLLTAVSATLVPWVAYAAARAAGATTRRAGAAGLVLALAPITAVGLFGLTPDLLLAPLWLGALALASLGLREGDASFRGAASLLGAGLLAGISASAKAPGLLLVLGLAAGLVWIARSDGPESGAARSIWPWAGLAAGLVAFVPTVLYEARLGWPMIRHRLVDTQGGAGLSLRNVGAVLGGQLLYVSPVLAVLLVFVARDLWRTRREDATSRLLFAVFVAPFVPLLVLSLWSKVAEPHWLAPAWLALLVHGARRGADLLSRRVTIAALLTAALATTLAHVYVLVPASARLVPAAPAETGSARMDIASELYGWPEVFAAVRDLSRATGTPFDPEGREAVVVGPHWTICGQLHAGLPGIRVGCATEVPDDFDRWLPRASWRAAEHVLFVTDARFPEGGGAQLPDHVLLARREVTIRRGGRTTRTFTLSLFARRQSASAPARAGSALGGIATRPASRMRARSSSSPGLAVVRSLSP